jgi:signal transduction histidine kinase
LSVAGTIEGIVGVARDITERKRREQELEAQYEQFRYVEEIADIGYWEVDMRSPEDTGPKHSPGAIDIYELPRGESLGVEEALTYYHPEDRPELEAAIDHLTEEGEPYDLEGRLTTDAGNERWVQTVGEPVEIDGEVVKIRGTIQDITDRKQQEHALQAENERLDQFASVVSHDLRNPLNIATGRLELTSQECDNEHIAAIGDALGRMERIIEDVLWLAREGRDLGETTWVDLEDRVQTAWSFVADGRENAHLGLDSETEGLGRIRADGGRLQQLLENLLRNAIEHGGTGVTVHVGCLDEGFYIEDDGPGIPVSERDEVFEVGYSTAETGTGFGLNIVEQVAEAHGWEITVTEGAVGGARFEVTGVELGSV